jgi:hypothetical protein
MNTSLNQRLSKYLTFVKKYQPLKTCPLQVSDQGNSREAQTEKCLTKEAGRQRLIDTKMPIPCADTNWEEVATEQKLKQSAVTTLMKQVKKQGRTGVEINKGEPTVKKTGKRKVVKDKDNGKANKGNHQQVITRTPTTTSKTVIQLCGCRHGDLDALRSFTKSDAKYYNRPNTLLEGRTCLDCKLAVTNMTNSKKNQLAVVFYCDEGIKGFDAPDDDPMKEELTCSLIVCPQCVLKRRIKYNLEIEGRPGNGRKRNRRVTAD